MIRLSFVTGGALRKVIIDERKIVFFSQETGFTPISFDLDKLEDNPKFKKLNEEQRKLLAEIKALETEEEMAKDITRDFQSTGWRLFKRENGSN